MSSRSCARRRPFARCSFRWPGCSANLEEPERANVILVSGGGAEGEALAAAAAKALGIAAQASDVGLKVIAGGRERLPEGAGGGERVTGAPALIVESASGLLSDELFSAVERGARQLEDQTLPVLTYLANTIRTDTREIP